MVKIKFTDVTVVAEGDSQYLNVPRRLDGGVVVADRLCCAAADEQDAYCSKTKESANAQQRVLTPAVRNE